jgi:hypothetical protein
MRLSDIYRGVTGRVRAPFSDDTTGLPDAISTEMVELRDGGSFDLNAAPVRKRLREAVVRMLAYNGSIPGPTLRVSQGSEVTINFTNEAELETTVHWHGLRLDNRYDGVPHAHHKGMQAPHPGRRRLHVQAPLPRPRRLLVPPACPGGLHSRAGALRQHHRRPERSRLLGARESRAAPGARRYPPERR